MPIELDTYDIRLLEALQAEGDLTMTELSERVFLSHSQCSRRAKSLRENGVISGYAAILDPAKIGLTLKAYVTVTLKYNSMDAVEFRQWVLACPEILECAVIIGDGDYILKIHARDLPHFKDLLEQLTKLKMVSTIKTTVVMDDVKNTTALPVYR